MSKITISMLTLAVTMPIYMGIRIMVVDANAAAAKQVWHESAKRAADDIACKWGRTNQEIIDMKINIEARLIKE